MGCPRLGCQPGRGTFGSLPGAIVASQMVEVDGGAACAVDGVPGEPGSGGFFGTSGTGGEAVQAIKGPVAGPLLAPDQLAGGLAQALPFDRVSEQVLHHGLQPGRV